MFANYRRLLGIRVRDLRVRRGLSQQKLADAAGITRQYLIGIENGENNPTLQVLLGLQAGLELSSMEQLLTGIPEWGSAEMIRALFGEDASLGPAS